MSSRAITAWQNGATGAGVTVGIVDTGIDTASPDFAGRISAASAAYGGNLNYQDQDGHGTAVAGILAAGRNDSEIMGVAFNSTILALRADKTGTCAGTDGCTFFDSDVAAALNRATDNGARVVNLSLGGPDGITTTLRNAIDRATKAGVILVVSAGNERDKTTPEYDPSNPSPFAMEMQAAGNGLVIIVNSVNAQGQISAFSDLAGTAQNAVIGALGQSVRSLDIKNDGFYYLFSGTSFAAPQVAGAVALLAQAFPNLSSAQIVELILSRARDAGAPGTDSTYGRGILDIAAAFAPVGTTSLAGSTVAVSTTDNGSLSSAMGDAAGTAGTGAVAIDGWGRAYRIDLQRTLSSGAPRAVLSPLAFAPTRSSRFGAGPLSGAMRFGLAPMVHDRFGERAPLATGRDASGEVALSFGRHGVAAFGFNRAAAEIGAGPAEQRTGAFLSAQGAARSMGFEASPDVASRFDLPVGSRTTLSFMGERGTVARVGRAAVIAAQGRPADDYASVTAAMGWSGRGADFTLSATMLSEDRTILGGRLAPFFGVGGTRTLFADVRAGTGLPLGLRLDGSVRSGWTRAIGGGRADLRSSAWSLDLGRERLFGREDRLGLRIAQPLRVEAGGVDAMLPTAFDYATGTGDWRRTRVNLSPSGREIDAELSYGARAGAGWIDVNGFVRRQPGHIAAAPADVGGAIRFAIGY